MVAYIRKMAVGQRHWLDEETFKNGVALCQAIPGATAMQTAAYVGLQVRGIPGALCAFVGFGLPAFVIMAALAAFYVSMHSLPTALAAFEGLQAIIVSIVVNATVSFARGNAGGWRGGLVALLAALLFWFRITPILTIVLAAFSGIPLRLGAYKADGLKETAPSRLSWGYVVLLGSVGLMGTAVFFFDPHLFDLMALMSRIDLFAFGGGFSSLPLMYHEIVEVRSWLDGQTLLNGIALGQVTPGPIVITAAFIGFLVRGFPGSIAATIGVFTPSFLMVVGLAPFFERLRRTRYFSPIIAGTTCSFVGLLVATSIRFGMNVPWDIPRVSLAVGALIALIRKVDILWVVLAGTILSVLVL